MLYTIDKFALSPLMRVPFIPLSFVGERDPRCPVKGLEEVLRKVTSVYHQAGVPETLRSDPAIKFPFQIPAFPLNCHSSPEAKLALMKN
jgi:hypothetical protein